VRKGSITQSKVAADAFLAKAKAKVAARHPATIADLGRLKRPRAPAVKIVGTSTTLPSTANQIAPLIYHVGLIEKIVLRAQSGQGMVGRAG
jgi:hypothetical protein